MVATLYMHIIKLKKKFRKKKEKKGFLLSLLFQVGFFLCGVIGSRRFHMLSSRK